MKEESQKLIALRFQYTQGVREDSFETIPFYKKKLRRFLRENTGKAVWLKGGVIERPAYLIFYKELKDEVTDLLSDPLEYGGYFKTIEPVNPMEVILKYAKGERVIVGLLKLPSGLTLGSPVLDEKEAKITEKVRKGFFINEYEHIKAEYAEISKIDPNYAILHNATITFNDGRTFNEKALALRIEDIKIHPTEVERAEGRPPKPSNNYLPSTSTLQPPQIGRINIA